MKEKISEIKEKIIDSQKNFLTKIKNFLPKKDNSNILKIDKNIGNFGISEGENINEKNISLNRKKEKEEMKISPKSKILDFHKNVKDKISDFHSEKKEKFLTLHTKTKENISNFHANQKEKILDFHENSKKNIFGFFEKLKPKKNFLKKEKVVEKTFEKREDVLNNNIFSESDLNPELKKEEDLIEKEKSALEKEKIELNEEKIEVKEAEEKLNEDTKNSFSEIFKDESGDDIFSGVLKKKNSISISDNLDDVLEDSGDEKVTKGFFNFKVLKNSILVLNNYIIILILFLISFFVSIYLFFFIINDENNYIFSYFGGETIGSKNIILEKELDNKKDSFLKIESSIKKMAGDVPSVLYLKTPYFIGLSEDIKNSLFKYYDNKTGLLKNINNDERNDLIILFNNNEDLSQLKNTFIKQDILNYIVDNRIYWKSVYKDLIDVTNSVFQYNEVINYVTYNNFSVDSEGKISVSGVVLDPSGKVFSQLFRLEKAINNSEHFSGVSIDNFNKTVNPDKNVGGMMTSISLTFNYIK